MPFFPPITCNHAVSGGYTLEHQLDQPHISARLQVADALLKDGCEDAPNFRLTRGLALVQQLHHAHDALGFLDDEVHLQVKLAADQLGGGIQRERRGKEREERERDGCRGRPGTSVQFQSLRKHNKAIKEVTTWL